MPPGSEQALSDAAASGWETWLVLAVVIGCFIFLTTWNRQLQTDYRELNLWVRNDHADVLDGLTIAFITFASSRPCLHDSDKLLQAATDAALDDPSQLDAVAKKALERRQRRAKRKEESAEKDSDD